MNIGKIATIALAVSLSGCSSAPDLDLKMRRLGNEILVTNKESDSLSGCWVQIDSEYTVKDVFLPAHQEVALPIEKFVSSSGYRFKGSEKAQVEVLVQCFEPVGRSAGFAFENRALENTQVNLTTAPVPAYLIPALAKSSAGYDSLKFEARKRYSNR